MASEQAIAMASLNEAARVETKFEIRDILAEFPENMRFYLKAKSIDEAQRHLKCCLLMKLGLTELNNQLTSYTRNEEVKTDISSALVFDVTDKAYDDRAIKYAKETMQLEEGMKEQLQCSHHEELLTLTQVALSDCMELKKKNIELSDEIATKQGKPSGVDGRKWFGLPAEIRDSLCHGTEDQKKRLAIEGYGWKELADSLREEMRTMTKEEAQRGNELLSVNQKCKGIENSLQEHKQKLHAEEKRRDNFEKLYEDVLKKRKEDNSKLTKVTSDREKYKQLYEQYDRSYKQQAKDMKKLSDEKKRVEKSEMKCKKEFEELLKINYKIQEDRASMTETLRVQDEHIQKLASQLHHSERYLEFYKQESMKWKQETSKLTGQLNSERQQVTFATENISRLQQQVVELNKTREDALTRLSKLAGARLTQGNAEIADLSDPDRPTKLAEQFSELYDNQWTDSLEELTGNTLPEEIGVKLLLSIVLEAYRFCCKIHLGQKEALNAALVTLPPIDVEVSHTLVTTKNAEVEVDDELKSDLEKLRRKVILNAKPILQKRFRGIVLHMLQKSISKDSTDEEIETDVNEEDSEKAEKDDMEPVPLVQTDPPAADDSSRAVDLGVSELDIPDTDSESSSVQQGRFGKEGVPDKPSASTKEESGNQAVSGKPVPLQETEPPAADDSNAAGVSELDKQGTALEAEASSEQQDKFLIVGVPDIPSASTKEESGNQAVSGKPDIGDKYDNVYLNKLQTTHKSEDDENRKKQKLWNSWNGEPNQRLVELQRASKSLSINDRRRAKDSDIILILQGLTQPDNHVTVEEDYGKQYPCTFEFAKICLDICWKMRLQDPEVYMEDCEEETGSFNNDKYKAYTRTGKQLDYVVWPALYLHKNGPMLSKGVAQPKMKK